MKTKCGKTKYKKSFADSKHNVHYKRFLSYIFSKHMKCLVLIVWRPFWRNILALSGRALVLFAIQCLPPVVVSLKAVSS